MFSSSRRFSQSLSQKNSNVITQQVSLDIFQIIAARAGIPILVFLLLSNDRDAQSHSAMHRPTDKIGTRISEVVSRYRSREEKRAKCRSSYLSSPACGTSRVVREYFTAIPCADPRAASTRERKRGGRVLHSSRAILLAGSTYGRHSSTCNHSTSGTHAAARLIHAYKTAPEFGGVRDHVSRAIRISRE